MAAVKPDRRTMKVRIALADGKTIIIEIEDCTDSYFGRERGANGMVEDGVASLEF